jgi:hypothetical protein
VNDEKAWLVVGPVTLDFKMSVAQLRERVRSSVKDGTPIEHQAPDGAVTGIVIGPGTLYVVCTEEQFNTRRAAAQSQQMAQRLLGAAPGGASVVKLPGRG